MKRYLPVFGLLVLLLFNTSCSRKDSRQLAEKQQQLAEVTSLKNDIMPIFKRSCEVCHNRQNTQSPATANGVYFETTGDLTRKIGKTILPGKPDNSRLYQICAREQTIGDESLVMPPQGSGIPKWSNSELQKLAKWIAAGALNN